MDKQPTLKLWDQHSTWETAETAWDARAKEAAARNPLKVLHSLPKMVGVTPQTARFLRIKASSYLIRHDKQRVILRYLLRWNYIARLFRSYKKPRPFLKEGDFFLYGLPNLQEFEKLLADSSTLVVIGFSYCHKPHECPSGRFSTHCQHNASNPVCQQCFIGKTMNALPSSETIIPLFITTIHYIGEEMCKLVQAYPKRQVVFLITACEMTLLMFADFGNMIGIRGVGVRLDGRICNTMQAFHLSENGIKPGLTVVLPKTQENILHWVSLLRKRVATS